MTTTKTARRALDYRCCLRTSRQLEITALLPVSCSRRGNGPEMVRKGSGKNKGAQKQPREKEGENSGSARRDGKAAGTNQ